MTEWPCYQKYFFKWYKAVRVGGGLKHIVHYSEENKGFKEGSWVFT